MLPAALDNAFPYICFTYGVVMTVALNLHVIEKLAHSKLSPDVVAQWRSHRGLAAICMGVGGLWILQNLWLA